MKPTTLKHHIMKTSSRQRSTPILWFGVFLSIALSPLHAQTPEAGGEMLVNPGFESCPSTPTPVTAKNAEQFGLGASHKPGSPAVGWSLNSLYPTILTVITDEKAAHMGKVCVKIGYRAPEATETAAGGNQAALCAGRFSVSPGEKYGFTFWARRDGASSPTIVFVYQYDEKFGFLGSAVLGQPAVNAGWQEQVLSYEVKNPKTKFVFFAIHTPSKGGELYLDDASLKPTGLAASSAIPAPTGAPAPAVIPAGEQTHWSDCATLVSEGKITMEGKGWTNVESFYDRLPAKANGVATPAVWGLSHNSAGLCFRFETDATVFQVRWTLTRAALAMPHMPATGVSGVDLYVKTADGKWLFQPRKFGEGVIGTASTFLLDAGRKACVLYLPLYNGVKSIELGVPEGQAISKIQEVRSKPIVVYGTSIAQGGCASRPGLAWTSIVGRHLDVPVINMGFSGSGKMEMEMADLLAELDPSVYVLDCLPNMTPALVSERLESFVQKLRSMRPKTPIMLVEDADFRNTSPTPKGKELRPIYEKLKGTGDGNLYFLSSEGVLGEDGEGTVDGLHPNDLGMMRQALAVEKALRAILTTTIAP